MIENIANLINSQTILQEISNPAMQTTEVDPLMMTSSTTTTTAQTNSVYSTTAAAQLNKRRKKSFIQYMENKLDDKKRKRTSQNIALSYEGCLFYKFYYTLTPKMVFNGIFLKSRSPTACVEYCMRTGFAYGGIHKL
jgi:hypothetical protein